jgi:hypothetical protein
MKILDLYSIIALDYSDDERGRVSFLKKEGPAVA